MPKRGTYNPPLTYTRASAPSEHSSALITKAAIRIQRVWNLRFKKLMSRKLAAEFLDPVAGCLINTIKGMKYETLVAKIHEEPRIKIVRDFLKLVYVSSIDRHRITSGLNFVVDTRVFMAGFMIAYHHTSVFEQIGDLEKTVMGSSREILELTEQIAKHISAHGSFQAVSSELTKEFHPLLLKYVADFMAWKIPDEIKIKARIIHALIALEEAQMHLPEDEPADSRLNVQLKLQTDRLRAKLTHIAGPSALTAHDDSRAAWRSTVTRGVGGCSTPSIGGRVSNEELGHELLLDPRFQLSDHSSHQIDCPISVNIRNSFHEAFYASLVDDLKCSPPCYVRIIRLFRECKDGFSGIACGRVEVEINNAIDIEFIEGQLLLNLFTWESCKKLVSSVVVVVRRIQAPSRDVETTTKWNKIKNELDNGTVIDHPRIFVNALKFMMECLSLAHIDAANARLRLIAPVMLNHGIEYEREKFQRGLASGAHTLERTKNWIDRTIARETAIGTLSIQDLLDGNSFVALHVAGIIDSIVSPTVIVETILPETMSLDTHHFLYAQTQYNRIVDTAAVLVSVTHNMIGATPTIEKRTAFLELSNSLVEGLDSPFDINAVLTKLNAAMENAGVNLEQAERARIMSSVVSNIKKDDAVHKLIADRVRKAWVSYMITPVQLTEAQFMAPARCLIPRIQLLAVKLHRVASVNRTVHAHHYNTLVAEAAQAHST